MKPLLREYLIATVAASGPVILADLVAPRGAPPIWVQILLVLAAPLLVWALGGFVTEDEPS